MHLDRTVPPRPRKQTLMLSVIVAAAVLLPVAIPFLRHWRAGTMMVLLTLTNWVMRGVPRRASVLAFEAAAALGGFSFDYLYRQEAPLVSPLVFLVGFAVLLVPVRLWVQRPGRQA